MPASASMPPDAPADDAEPVDHGRVRVGADERVGVEDAALREDALREVLEVDLVDDADSRRDDLEAVERLHAPLQELVAGAVALELDAHVRGERVRRGPLVHLHRVVDDERDGDQRLDQLRVAAEPSDRRAHRREIHEQRDPGEVLQDDPGHHERDLGGPLGLRLPGGEGAHVVFLDPLAVAVAQQRLEDDADRDGQAANARGPVPLEVGERVERAGAARTEGEAASEALEIRHHRYRITRVPG